MSLVAASASRLEVHLAFAGLHQLCVSMLDRLERLPAAPRGALAAAFGLAEEGLAPDHDLLGSPCSTASTVGADGHGELREGRQYQLVRVPDAVRERTLRVVFDGPGAVTYACTFGVTPWTWDADRGHRGS